MRNTVFIFVPGYKGSVLKEKSSGNIIWLRLTCLFQKNSNLDFKSRGIVASGLLDEVPLIPFIYNVNIYKKWLGALRENSRGKSDIIPFDYDWRGDIASNARLLYQCVNTLQKNGYGEITIIAHSLGGLITSYFLRYGKQELETAKENWEGAGKVKSVIFGGVPFRGTMRSFKDIFEGERLFFNRRLLNKYTIRSFPVTYQLLPFGNTRIKVQGQSEEIFKMHDRAAWEELHFHQSDSQLQFMAGQLKRSELLYGLLNAAPNASRPGGLKVLNLIGRGHPTLDNGVIHKRKAKLYSTLHGLRGAGKNAKRPCYADGDGTVCASSAAIPGGFSDCTQEYSANSKHRDIFHNRAMQNRLFEFINKHPLNPVSP